jgi:hypothetical protein
MTRFIFISLGIFFFLLGACVLAIGIYQFMFLSSDSVISGPLFTICGIAALAEGTYYTKEARKPH